MVSTLKERFQVLVIGCGPVGLFAAYLLGQRGIKTLVVDKHTTRRGQPKAHAVNPRSLEIFKQVGLDTDQVRRAGIEPNKVDVVRIVSTFYGWEFGTLPYERQFDDVKNLTPEPLVNISQPLIEEFLNKAVLSLPTVTVRRGVEWVHVDEIEDCQVQSTLLVRESGHKYEVVSNYLLACDGARATSRDLFGIGFHSVPGAETAEKRHVTTHFHAELPGKKSGILFFMMQPHGVRAMIRYGENEWVLVRRFDPNIISASTFDEETCRQLIHEALGRSEDLEILSTTIWSSVTKVADCYRSNRVRNAFLAGDAAHTFPPTGGLGVNTGFADVHNLVWKIEAVMLGLASDAILESYNRERRPVAVQNARQSATNERNMDKLGAAINPKGVTEDAAHNWSDGGFIREVQELLQLNAVHFNSLGLQLGFRYGHKDVEEVSNYTPIFADGARLPHTYVMTSGTQQSVLDLISYRGFTILSPKSSVADEIATLSSGLAEYVKVVVLGKDFETQDQDWLNQMFTSRGDRVVLIRPDQHIAGFVTTEDSIFDLLLIALK